MLVNIEVKKMSTKTKTMTFEKPLTTVDVVIFTVRDDVLQVLLIKRPAEPDEPFPGALALPGGFVDVQIDSSLEACAMRKLLDKTGVKSPYLEQLGSWGGRTRDPRGWSATHAYFALLPASSVQLQQDKANVAQWHSVDELSSRKRLAFDHGDIFQAALERLRSKVEYTSLPAFLLEEPFTLPQLQKMYEIVLGRPVDKSGFRTRALAAEFMKEDGFMEVGSPRPAMGYRLKNRNQVMYFPRTFSPRS
jgi:8-oxo-dGTP diphosphatase